MQSVLMTGARSGFGRLIDEALAKRELTVAAGTRECVRIDLSQEEMAAAAAHAFGPRG
jgi:NADP-dependent 3-hydroxy acid dehydrogenase YdfG